MKTWIVICDASRARIFEAGGSRGELNEVRSIIHPSSRLKTSELVSDREGRIAKGAGHAAMEGKTPPHDGEANRFAAIVASTLDLAIAKGQCGSLILVSPARFLGRLRPLLSPRAVHAVIKTVRRDLTKCTARELAAALSPEVSLASVV